MLSKRKINFLKHLSRKRYRNKYNKIIIEGSRLIEQALDLEQEFDCIYVTKSAKENLFIKNLLKRLSKLFLIKEISDNESEQISQTETPQGIYALFTPNFPDIKNFAYALLLDRIQDCGNLGTIIRTAEAAGIRKILLCKGTADILNPKTLRASMGAIFNIDFEYIEDNNYLSKLKMQGFKIFATTLSNGIFYYKLKEKYNKLILVLGNEAKGIEPNIIDMADKKIKIPIHGKIESLNVSTAAAILIYHFKYKLN